MGGTTKQTERILRQPVEKNETQALKQQVHAWTNNMRQLPAKVNVSCFRDSKMWHEDWKNNKVHRTHGVVYTKECCIKQLHTVSACQWSQVNTHFLLHTQHSYCRKEATLWDADLSHAYSLAIACEENLQTEDSITLNAMLLKRLHQMYWMSAYNKKAMYVSLSTSQLVFVYVCYFNS